MRIFRPTSIQFAIIGLILFGSYLEYSHEIAKFSYSLIKEFAINKVNAETKCKNKSRKTRNIKNAGIRMNAAIALE